MPTTLNTTCVLDISPTLKLPLNGVTEKLAFLGRTGSGKSYAATKLAEAMHAAGAQIIAIDPVGIWYGLRSAADGKSPGIAIPVFGGLHGDIPLEATGGALMADLIVDKHLSCVLDISQFEHDTDKARFLAAFGKRLFFRKKSSPSAMHLFLEECEEILPQNPERGEEQMIHEFKRIWKLGRNFGMGGSLISQRPQEILKKALNLSEGVFAFQTNGPHERKAIDTWISEKGLDQDIAADLPKLAQGQCHLWSPSWLKVSETIRIAPKWTFDASATPTVGTARKAAHLAKIDLVELAEHMRATVERAKESDPSELKARLKKAQAELDRLSTARSTPAPRPAAAIKEVPTLTASERKRLTQLITRFDFEKLLVKLEGQVDEISALQLLVKQVLPELVFFRNLLTGKTAHPAVAPRLTEARWQPLPRPSRPASATRPALQARKENGEATLGRCERAILTVLQQYPQGRSVTQLALLTGYSGTSGGFNNALGKLRSLAYVTRGPLMQITDAGGTSGLPAEPLPTGQALVDHWLARLPKCERAILRQLTHIYPNDMTLDELGAATGYASTSGGFNNALGKLRTLELIARGQPIKAIIHHNYGSE